MPRVLPSILYDLRLHNRLTLTVAGHTMESGRSVRDIERESHSSLAYSPHFHLIHRNAGDTMPLPYGQSHKLTDAEHITIYHNPKEFAAWPFNHGLWHFPDGEVLVSFSRGPCSYQSKYDMSHAVVDAPGR